MCSSPPTSPAGIDYAKSDDDDDGDDDGGGGANFANAALFDLDAYAAFSLLWPTRAVRAELLFDPTSTLTPTPVPESPTHARWARALP